MTLDQIAIKHGCDKSSLKHDYCRIYEQYVSTFNNTKIPHLLEIGFGGYEDSNAGGESARMWREAYPDMSISVMDIYQKDVKINGVYIWVGNATVDRPQWMMDIIIDDGSHLNADIIAAFKNLWPVLNPGGLYCVEDTHSSYDPYYADSNPNFEAGKPQTAMDYFTFIAHHVNRDFIKAGQRFPELFYDIEFLHFYKDLIIIKKKAA